MPEKPSATPAKTVGHGTPVNTAGVARTPVKGVAAPTRGAGGGKKGGKKGGGEGKPSFNLKALQPAVVHKQNTDLITYSNGDHFEGLHQGPETIFLPNGPGKYTISSTSAVYQGAFEEGVLLGRGTVHWKNGDALAGEFDLHGGCEGVLEYRSGDKYEGQVLHGLREGKGKMHYTSGALFDGQWSKDMREEHGRLAWPSGDWVEGEWRGGSCPKAAGRHTEANGDVFEGALSVTWEPPEDATLLWAQDSDSSIGTPSQTPAGRRGAAAGVRTSVSVL
jgi:hypothetical protein